MINKRPKLSGYCITLNCIDSKIPFMESIRNHLQFCDEVVVVDGGSTDGTLEKLNEIRREISNGKLVIYHFPWNYNKSDMMGFQKTQARHHCTGDYCWQFDCDEFLPEWQHDAVHSLIRNYPTVELFDLPCITFYGNMVSVAAQENHFKWRLSKNLPHIIHGVHKEAWQTKPDGAKFFAREVSDSCEYIDRHTGEIIGRTPPINQELWKMNLKFMDKPLPHDLWGKCAKLIEEFLNSNSFPCVYHYSWVDYARKAEMSKFWAKQKRHYDNEGRGTKEGMWVDKKSEEINPNDIKELTINFAKKPTFYVDVKRHPCYAVMVGKKENWNFVEKFVPKWQDFMGNIDRSQLWKVSGPA